MRLFGTDGVRGKANIFPMTVETAVALGKATALLLRRKKEGRHKVVIGKDTRLSCYMFENALIAGLTSMGVDTLMVGPLPTPGVAFITRAYRASCGIVISASHNSFFDNGIKIFNEEGFKLSDHFEHEIEEMVAENSFSHFLPKDEEMGRNKRIEDANGRYIEFAKATFPKGKNLKGLKIVLDCAHGAGHRSAPHVVEELDATLFLYGHEPNGLNINLECGSLYPALVQKKTLEHQADVGIALDGDADRVIMVDERGEIVDGDMMLAISASHLHRKGLLKNNRIVATVMTNFGVLQYLRKLGIEVILSKVGDRYVIQDMLNHSAFLGGEQSGHLIFLEHNTTGDGIVSALQILRIMQEEQKSLSALCAGITKTPQILNNVKVTEKMPLESLPSVKEAISDAEKLLGERGRVLVRYSGTENVLRVMVEGEEKPFITTLAKKIADAIDLAIGVHK